MLYVSSRDRRTTLWKPFLVSWVRFYTQLVMGGNIMYRILLVPSLLIWSEQVFLYNPRICKCDLWDLREERLRVLLLNRHDTATSCGVCYHKKFVEPRFHDIIFPNEASMFFHGGIVGYRLFWVWISIVIRVHNQHRNAVWDSPLDLREHWADLKAVKNADWSSPHTSSHLSCSLDQYKGVPS